MGCEAISCCRLKHSRAPIATQKHTFVESTQRNLKLEEIWSEGDINEYYRDATSRKWRAGEVGSGGECLELLSLLAEFELDDEVWQSLPS